MAKAASRPGKGKAQHSSKHHPRPRSRGGCTNDGPLTLIFPGDEGKRAPRKHRAWHALFAHRTIAEAMLCAAVFWRKPDGSLNLAYLPTKVKLAAWEEIFGSLSASPRKTVERLKDLCGARLVRNEVSAQLQGRTPADIAAGMERVLVRLFPKGVPFVAANQPLVRVHGTTNTVAWQMVFDSFPVGEALFYTSCLWRDGNGAFAKSFLGKNMQDNMKRLFGTLGADSDATFAWLVEHCGEDALRGDMALMLAGRDMRRFCRQIDRFLARGLRV